MKKQNEKLDANLVSLGLLVAHDLLIHIESENMNEIFSGFGYSGREIAMILNADFKRMAIDTSVYLGEDE